MEIRKSTIDDLSQILTIIQQAQAYFKENNIDQWQNNYPNKNTILDDLAQGESYVLTEGENILATVVVSFAAHPHYEKVYEGKWLSNQPFAVIHRIAVNQDFKGRGVSSELLGFAEQICRDQKVYSLKVDTHKDNLSMQRLLEKNAYTYCGYIYLSDNSTRICFEKLL